MSSSARRVWVCFLALVSIAAPPADGATDPVLRVPRLTQDSGAVDKGKVVVRGPWGSGPGEFGKVDEASRPGPMDFAVRGETLYVLDPVNGRVQRFGMSGAYRGEVSLGTKTADFMCVDDNGQITVLDAFVRREFKTFSAEGELLSHARVPALIGLSSAIFTDGERVWIEERHNRVYELTVARSRPGVTASVAEELAGRPLGRDGHTIHARKKGTHSVVLLTNTATGGAERLTLEFPRRLASIVALEVDDCDRTYLAAACAVDEVDRWSTDIAVVVITPEGEIAGTIRLPDAYVTDHYRKVCVSPVGEILQMQTTEDEVRFVRWTLDRRSDEGKSR